MRARTTHPISAGDRFGRWTVVGGPIETKRGEGNSHRWIVRFPCRCDCGTTRDVWANSLLKSNRSCGCLRIEQNTARQTKHGQSIAGKPTRIYRIWSAMIARCHGTSCAKNYPDYGGRGVAVCDEWRGSFEAFQDWAFANGYGDSLTIDRVDPDGHYLPSNCRWVTMSRQARNRRDSVMLTHDGRTMNVADWAEELGLKYSTLCSRVHAGWSTHDVLFRPIRLSSRYHAIREG